MQHDLFVGPFCVFFSYILVDLGEGEGGSSEPREPSYGLGVNILEPLRYECPTYMGTSLNRAADSLYFMLMLQKLWAVQWVWPITAYVFKLHSRHESQGARIRKV